VLYKNLAGTMGFPHKTAALVRPGKTRTGYKLAKTCFQQFQFYNIFSCLFELFPFTLLTNINLPSVVSFIFMFIIMEHNSDAI